MTTNATPATTGLALLAMVLGFIDSTAIVSLFPTGPDGMVASEFGKIRGIATDIFGATDKQANAATIAWVKAGKPLHAADVAA